MPIRQLADRFLLYVWEPFILALARRSRGWQWRMNDSALARWSSLIVASLYLVGLTIWLPLWLIPMLFQGCIALMQQVPFLVAGMPFIKVVIFLVLMGGYIPFSLMAGNLIFYLIRIGNGVVLHPYYSISLNQEQRIIERHNIPGYYGEKRRLFAQESYVAWLELIDLMEMQPALQAYQIVAHSIFYRYSRDFSTVERGEVGWARLFTVMHLLRNWQWCRALQLLFQAEVREERLLTTYEELKRLEPIFRMKAGYHVELATSVHAMEQILDPLMEHGQESSLVDGEGGIS